MCDSRCLCFATHDVWLVTVQAHKADKGQNNWKIIARQLQRTPTNVGLMWDRKQRSLKRCGLMLMMVRFFTHGQANQFHTLCFRRGADGPLATYM